METAKSFIHRWRRPKSGGAPGERFEPGRVCALAVGAQAHGPALGGRHDAADWRGARLADAGEAARHPDSHLEGLIEWPAIAPFPIRSEEHTSELQSLMRISYAVFCLKTTKQLTSYNYNSNT